MHIFAPLLRKVDKMYTKIFKHLIFIMLIAIGNSPLAAQSFGIRAGLNYTKFSGPTEAGVGEKFSISNGFHFGVNYAYKLTDVISIKTELLYTQVGSGYDYNGESFYKIPLSSSLSTGVPNAYLYEKGKTEINMKISNAYISIPIVAQYEIHPDWEISAGIYGSVLIGPRGNGTLRFNSTNNPEKIFFKQSLIHNYNSDDPGGSSGFTGPWVFVNDARTPIARDAGAYYNYLSTEHEGKLYKPFDFGLTGGVSYFVNKGLFIGFRYDFGLLDITNNKVDAYRKNYDEVNNRFIFSKDFDRNTGFQVSFGFRF
jgi:hypothetical protein